MANTLSAPNIIQAPTQRVLKIVNTHDFPLPFDRLPNYLYMVYDKMDMYLYQSRYSDPFSIVESIPEINVMVENMLYITLDGYMKTKWGNNIVELGTVEKVGEQIDPAQLAILRKVGTVYFMNAESRYLDVQTRMIHLPYQNGEYQLSLSLSKELLIDNDTLIKYNQETNQFEIMGNEFQPFKWLKDIYKYISVTSKSIETYIEDGFNAIRSNLKISDTANNGITVLENGLFVNVGNFTDLSKYDKLVQAYYDYQVIIDHYIIELRNALNSLVVSITPEAVDEKIHEVLLAYEPTIDQMLDQYDDLAQRIEDLEVEVYRNLDIKIDAAKEEILDYIAHFQHVWEILPADLDEPYYEYHSH